MDPPKKREPDQGADEYLGAQRRIARLFEALGDAGSARGAGDDLPVRTMLVIARQAVTAHEFERHRKRLAAMGRAFELPEIFDLVARGLPGWCAWSDAPGDPAEEDPSSARAALRRLVANGKSPGEKGERLCELVRAAVRLLAQGSLGRAVSALVEAGALVEQAVVLPDLVKAARGIEFDLGLLRPFAAAPAQRASLSRFLRFFEFLRPIKLLQALAFEKRNERKNLILTLLEAGEEAARREALDLLRSELAADMGEDEAEMRRNLIHLLRRIPRSGKEGLDEEVAVLTRHADWQCPASVIREAIGALGQLPGRRAEQVLLRNRQLLEGMLAGTTQPVARPEEIRLYLDTVNAALARRETGTRPAPVWPESARLSGDSLPALLHRLAETDAAGGLLVEDNARTTAGTLTLREGDVVAARAGSLSGADAVYQLLETFEGGSALWSPRSSAHRETDAEGDRQQLRPLVLEGLRRRDALELARAIVPDDLVFAPVTSAPRPHPAEKDGLVTRDVWAAASAGRTPSVCERFVDADAFRIRRLYLYWLDEGAIEPVSPS